MTPFNKLLTWQVSVTLD